MLIERAAAAALAGACGAAIAAGGSYTVFYGIAYGTVNSSASGAGGALAELFLLLVAIVMSVGGDVLLTA